jgi:thiol-disulfide isomerase/thioredoxin
LGVLEGKRPITDGKPGRRPLALVAVIVAGLATGWLLWALLTPSQAPARGLPDLTLERLEGGQLQVASLTGSPAVINLWATWCPPCVRELPMMAAVAADQPDVQFVFADQGEARAAVEGYLAERPELQLRGVVLDRDVELGVEFETLGLPMTLFFDQHGNHVHSHAGELTESDLLGYLAYIRAGRLTTR